MNSSFRSSGRSQSARHAAMKHDRDHGDERRERGRSGRGAVDSRRSVSPQARRPRTDDHRDVDYPRHDSSFRSDSRNRHPRRSRDDSKHRSGRRSVSRDGRHRARDSSPRYSDNRGAAPSRTDEHSRERSRRSDAPGGGGNSIGGAGSKRHRSRSPPSANSRRKRSRRAGRNKRRSKHSPEFERPELPRRNRDRHRSPRRRGRSGESIDRDTDSVYDRATPERRHAEERSFHRGGSETRSHASYGGSRLSSPVLDRSPLSSPSRNTSRDRAVRSPSVASRGRADPSLHHPDSRRVASPPGQHRSRNRKGRSREDRKKDSSQPAATGANSVEVSMSSRGGGGSFRGGYPSQPGPGPFPHKGPFGNDPRTNYSQSSTPNSSYHNSPTSQSSSYGTGQARPGWNGQQFSPPHP